MPFVKGQSGNPGGQQQSREWTEAIRMAVHELRADPDNPKKVKALRLLARRIVTAGLEGDISAMKEIGDRLEGKASTQMPDLPQDVTGKIVFVMNLDGD